MIVDRQQEQLNNNLNKGLLDFGNSWISCMRQVRQHIKEGEYHSATLLMTKMTQANAQVSLNLRSILVSEGYLESEQ